MTTLSFTNAAQAQGVRPDVSFDQGVNWANAAGRPQIPVGKTSGFYIWHQGDEVHVASTDDSNSGQHFEGRIVVEDGSVSDVKPEKLERDDHFRQVAPNEIDFDFTTFHALDALKFKLHNGSRILFDLAIAGQRTGNVAYGRSAVQAQQDPLVFTIHHSKGHDHLIAWSQAAGKPQIDAGHSVGFYVWHEGDRVFVVSTSESDGGELFSGNIHLDGGTISDASGYKLEHDDRFTQIGPNDLTFRFKTAEGIDGVAFTVHGGKRLRLRLDLQGHPTGDVFIGQAATDVDREPVVFRLDR